jgi:hypothetical protein
VGRTPWSPIPRPVVHVGWLYQLNPEGFDSLREYFDQFWSLALTAFKKKVEEQTAQKE